MKLLLVFVAGLVTGGIAAITCVVAGAFVAAGSYPELPDGLAKYTFESPAGAVTIEIPAVY